MIKLVLPIFFTLLIFSADGQELSQSNDLQAQASIDKIEKLASDNPFNQAQSFLKKVLKIQKNKCPNIDFSDQHCYVSECDVVKKDCRADHVLLFRGESSLFSMPATSSFFRAYLKNINYTTDRSEWINQFKKDVHLIFPVNFIPENTSLYLVDDKEGLSRNWLLDSENRSDIYKGEYYPKDGKAYTLLQTIFMSHACYSYFYFVDSLNEKINLDPLISFSSSIKQAMRFVGEEKNRTQAGRLIILSVAKNKLQTNNKTTSLTPGDFVNGAKLNILQPHSEELEIDSLFYVDPNSIWRAFELSKENALQVTK